MAVLLLRAVRLPASVAPMIDTDVFPAILLALVLLGMGVLGAFLFGTAGPTYVDALGLL